MVIIITISHKKQALTSATYWQTEFGLENLLRLLEARFRDILRALEAMGFIYWDYMASNAEKQYTLRSTKYTLFNRTKGRWKYAPYNRSKYPNIAWVDEVVGPIETDDIYDFKNVVGYDIDECTRDWLRNNRSEGYESYEGLSICEVVLIDPRFSEIRYCVGIADVFISHMDSEPLLGEGSTTAQLLSFPFRSCCYIFP